MSSATSHLSAEARASLPQHVAVIMDGNGANRRWRFQFRSRGSRRESAVVQFSMLGHLLADRFVFHPRQMSLTRFIAFNFTFPAPAAAGRKRNRTAR